MIFSNKVETHKKQIAKFFDGRNINYLKKKKPKSDSYPFIQHDPFDIYGYESGLEAFYLIGDNWIRGQDKPIAVMWGFNDWKLGFTSDYLPEYRTLFVPLRMRGARAIRKLRKHLNGSSVFIAWGFNERRSAKLYAKYKGIPLWRMEDAFIRSSALGASHATPYSLILDKTGFYYDCSQPSDIENILNTTDFKANPELLVKAQKALDTLIDLKLSKYNLPSSNSSRISDKIKTRKRIVVLGQVDADASIRLGNPDNWTAEQLVKLAKFENPDAEVLYRPHPETYKGYQKSRFKKKRIERIATVVSPEEPFIESLTSIDHVYTITSLSGLEALLRGKKVTVVGAPFYAGWGLTDDRVKVARRKAKLELLELFAGSYLIYPKYLSKLDDAFIGIISSSYKIVADRNMIELDNKRSKILSDESINTVDELITCLLNNVQRPISLTKVDLLPFFDSKSFTFNFLLACAVIGKSTEQKTIRQVLNAVKERITIQQFNKLLLLVHDYYDFNTTEYEVWLLSQAGEHELSSSLCQSRIDSYSIPTTDTSILEDNVDESIEVDTTTLIELHQAKFNIAFGLSNFTSMVEAASIVFILGRAKESDFISLAKASEQTFDYDSSLAFINLLMDKNIRGNNKYAIVAKIRVVYSSGNYDIDEMNSLTSMLLSLKPELYESVTRLIFTLGCFSNVTAKESITNAIARLGYSFNTNYVHYLLEVGDINKARVIVDAMIKNGDSTDKVLVTFSKLLTTSGDIEQAYLLLKGRLENDLSLSVAREFIRVLNIRGGYFEVIETYKKLIANNLDICKSIILPSFLGMGRIKEGYECYLNVKSRIALTKFFPAQFLTSPPEFKETDMLIFSVYGPGDEIRFASIYNELIDYYPNIILTCDERLYSLFTRSFPNITFKPAKRVREVNPAAGAPASSFDQIPSSQFCSVMDNNVHALLQKAKNCLCVTDFLHKFRTEVTDFHGKVILNVNSEHKAEIASMLPQNKILVGVNWRSSLSGYIRDFNYLNIEQISKIFDVEDIVFINLQYDDCSSELEWTNTNYPGKLLNIDSIDQYNDFESVSALISCLDIVIAPCTSVAELAGSLGAKTLLLSNNEELHWRRDPITKKDLWFSSIEHIEADVPGDKLSLVNNLTEYLSTFVKGSFSNEKSA